MGKAFHKSCFKCNFCNKTLDSFTANDHEDRLFCRSCYSKNFGPRIYGFNSTTANLERNFEVAFTRSGSDSRSPLSNGSPFLNEPYSNGHTDSRFSPTAPREIVGSVWDDPTAPNYRPSKPRWGGASMGGVRCANCPDIVYANERVEAVGKVFHRLCFKCASCRRLLDRGTACDHKREIFCQNCYTKNFGSTGLKAGTNLRCE